MNKNSQIKLADYRALAEFRYHVRRYLHISEQAARADGIEPQQHQLLLAIKGIPDGEEPRIAYLAERLQIQHHSAVELVDRMVKKGLIARTRAESDRREVHVQLTAQGDRVLTELTTHMRAELTLAAPSLVRALRNLTARPARSKGPRQPKLAKKRAA